MIPFADRPLLHLRIATWLEQYAPLAFSELTAAQFELGGSPDAAYAHYLAAAELATTRREPAAVERLYETLLNLPVPADTLAEGALAYAQAALSLEMPAATRQALEQAAGLVERASADVRPGLRLVLDQLKQDALTLTG
jgi:hypothetical protein